MDISVLKNYAWFILWTWCGNQLICRLYILVADFTGFLCNVSTWWCYLRLYGIWYVSYMWPKRTKLLFRLDLPQTDLANFLSAWSSLHQAWAKEVVIAWWHSLVRITTWWRHQMEKFSALLTLCAGNSPVTGEFSAERPVTRSFDVFFDLHQIKRLSKHLRGWWFETLSRPLWRHCNECE